VDEQALQELKQVIGETDLTWHNYV
jgi:hypothetical protein